VANALTGEIPLISRDAEMKRMLARLRSPVPAAFVLAGASGVGKTRLASEVAKQAAAMGLATAHVAASRAAASIPFGPFAPFIPDAEGSAGDRLGLLRQASNAILGRAGPDRKLLLVVDDAQLLDDGSAALLFQLAQQPACSILASLRTPGPAPDPVTTLWKDGLAERIDLTPWSETETEAVLGAVLGGAIARGTVRRLWEMSQGNALYLRELAIGAVTSGALTQSGEIWALRQPLTAPGRLVELVASRLAGLPPETVAVVELLAVGEPLGLPLVEKLTTPNGLEDAEAQGLVRISTDGRRVEVRLGHPVYGEALRQSLPRSRRRRIAATLADVVQATGARRREDLLRLGRWKLDSGTPGEPELLDRAARRAMQMFDIDHAAKLARAALDAGAGASAGLVLGEAAFMSGRHAEAESVLNGVLPLCKDDAELAMVASARAHNFHNLLGDSQAAYQVLEAALAVITDYSSRMQLLARVSILRVYEPDPEAALAAAAPLIESGDDVLESRGCYSGSVALALLGRSDEAVALAYRGLEVHRRAMEERPGTLHHGWETQLIGAVFGHLAAGHLDLAEADADRAHQNSLSAGDEEGQATYLLIGGWIMIERGRLARATASFLDSASINRELHDPQALRWCLAGVALAEALSGHVEAATAAAAERDSIPVGAMLVYDPDLIERGKAWLCVARGEISLAGEILAQGAQQAAAGHLRIAEARLLHDLARIGQPEHVAARLAELAGMADGEYVPAMAAHAAALAAGNPDELQASAITFEQLGATLLAAEAYSEAATLFQEQGYLRAASAAARQAGELAAECGDVRTPALRFTGDASRLTPREREIASLAAAGDSSKEIAAKLTLSVRTVENHLQNAYSKLGVTSREELARLTL
jgi:DNA-binding CsgD family transcriptional regulator